MAKKKGKPFLKLKCTECNRINYFLPRLKDPEKKLELKKFCKWGRKHTLHKESKR